VGGATNSVNACGEVAADPECHTIVSGGATRAYILHVPATFQASTGALVIALHGSNGSGLRLGETSGLTTKADAAGFAVAYPYALVSPGAGITEWNEYFNQSFGASGPDDVAFLRLLITTLQATVHPDPKRI